jgi:DNA-binding IclR family transcriptional regulator
MTDLASSRPWVRGALRKALLAALDEHSGWGVSGLVRVTGWSRNAVQRELNALEQDGLARHHQTGRTRCWALTHQGKAAQQ